MKFDKVNSYFIKALKTALTGAVLPDAPQNFDWVRFYNLCKYHGVANTVYFALITNDTVPQKVVNKFADAAQITVAKQTAEEVELAELEEIFKGKNIPLLYLKGWVIRKLYPKEEMRSSSDIDILVLSEHIEQVKEIMLSRGYELTYCGVNEDIYKKPPFLNIEVHKTLLSPITSVGKKYDYSFKFAVNRHDNVYTMSDDDLYVHTFLHIVQHMQSSGIGVRFFADLFILSEKLKIDDEYIIHCFKKYGVYDFYCAVLKLLKMWFGDGTMDDITLEFADFVIMSGTYGRAETESINYLGSARDSLLLKRIFPPKEIIAFRYPQVLKHPKKLPLYWLRRFFDTKKPAHKLKVYSTRQEKLTEEQITAQKNLYKKIGLNI